MVATAVAMALAVPAGEAHSQVSRSPFPLVNSDAVDRLRYDQLSTGVDDGKSLLMRSASTLATLPSLGGRAWRVDFIKPQFLAAYNSEFPFSQNHGAMWAGRGLSTRTLTGVAFRSARATVIFAPQIIASDNSFWLLKHDYFQPIAPINYIGRGYTFPYYFYTFPIDHPLSFGPRRIRAFDMGESTAMMEAGPVRFGVSNENHWWGPGIRNALLLSNNAPGFPHFFVRTARPLNTPLGGVDITWLSGALKESRYFDTVSTNNTRTLSAIGVTLQSRWDPNLSFGVARSVYASADNWTDAPLRFHDVFRRTTRSNPDLQEEVLEDAAVRRGGRDQLFSLFGRWVFPESGAEVYGEWGRTRLPSSLADFLKAPNHTQGYTVGMQWRGDAFAGGAFRAQAEITQIEQSATFRDRPVGSWYTSSRVIQGYTHRGHVVGAAIGPGASSQFVALDFVRPSWQAGVFAGRIRWNEDVHSTYGFPDYVSYCSHDVTIYPGARASVRSRLGEISADVALQNRLNVLFQNGGGCPNNGNRLDLRNTALSLRVTPFSVR